MAVLVEAISVIVRADSLGTFPTWESFRAIVPNETLCADGELVRVGFLSPGEVRQFVRTLQDHGLRFSETGPAQDIVIADQQSGFTTPCDWAEFGRISWDNEPDRPVAAARLTGSLISQVLTPDGWTYEGSLTQKFEFHPLATSGHCGSSDQARGTSTETAQSSPHGRGIHVSGSDRQD